MTIYSVEELNYVMLVQDAIDKEKYNVSRLFFFFEKYERFYYSSIFTSEDPICVALFLNLRMYREITN